MTWEYATEGELVAEQLQAKERERALGQAAESNRAHECYLKACIDLSDARRAHSDALRALKLAEDEEQRARISLDRVVSEMRRA